MSIRNLFICIVVSVGLFGCSATKVQSIYTAQVQDQFAYTLITKPKMPEKAKQWLAERLDEKLSESSQLAATDNSDAIQVRINVTTYRMRYGLVRLIVGVFAGPDVMVSHIEIQKPGETKIAKFKITSANPTALGTAKIMVNTHADKIVNYLQSGGDGKPYSHGVR